MPVKDVLWGDSSCLDDRVDSVGGGGDAMVPTSISSGAVSLLEQIGQKDLIDTFKKWHPRTFRHIAPPLDQRVSITVSRSERMRLDKELSRIRQNGKTSMSQVIRDKALSTVDIMSWRDYAEKALREIVDTQQHRKMLEAERRDLVAAIDECHDDEDMVTLTRLLSSHQKRLDKLVAKSTGRRLRLSGRMSLPEMETVKWRANTLRISASDYLRMMVFDLHPDSSADAHMSLSAKKLFYVSILSVAEKGWGAPPRSVGCSQCRQYVKRIGELEDEIHQLRMMDAVSDG